jgi:hypothetical protein
VLPSPVASQTILGTSSMNWDSFVVDMRFRSNTIKATCSAQNRLFLPTAILNLKTY